MEEMCRVRCQLLLLLYTILFGEKKHLAASFQSPHSDLLKAILTQCILDYNLGVSHLEICHKSHDF